MILFHPRHNPMQMQSLPLITTILFFVTLLSSSSSFDTYKNVGVFAQTTTPPPAVHIGYDNSTRMIYQTVSYVLASIPTLYFAPTTAFSVMRGVRLDLFLCRGGIREKDEVGIGFFPATIAPTLKIGDTSKPGAETRGAIVMYLVCTVVAVIAALLKPKWSDETGREFWTVPPPLQSQMDDLHRQRMQTIELELEREIERIKLRRGKNSMDDNDENNNNGDGGSTPPLSSLAAKKKKKKKSANDIQNFQIEQMKDAQMNREIQKAKDRMITNNPAAKYPEIPASVPGVPPKPRPILSYVGLVYAQFLCPWAACAGFLFGVNEMVGQALSVIPFIAVLLFFLIFVVRFAKMTQFPSSRNLRVAPTIIVRRTSVEESSQATLEIEKLLKSEAGKFTLVPEACWEVPVAAQEDVVSFWNNAKLIFSPFWGPFETCPAILSPSGGPVITDSYRRIFSRHFFTISAGVAIAVSIMQGHGAVDRAFCKDYGRLSIMIVNCLYCVAFLLVRPYLLPFHNLIIGMIEVCVMFTSLVAALGIPDLDDDNISEGSVTTFKYLELAMNVVSILGGALILVVGIFSMSKLNASRLKIQHPTKRHMQMKRETSMSFLSVGNLGEMMEQEMNGENMNHQSNNNNHHSRERNPMLLGGNNRNNNNDDDDANDQRIVDSSLYYDPSQNGDDLQDDLLGSPRKKKGGKGKKSKGNKKTSSMVVDL